jgi:ubiquinone/menaquinone biosynthesis C-methylase UbiE
VTNPPDPTPDPAAAPAARAAGGRKVANQYDRGYDYTAYWRNRDYESAAEQQAIRALLGTRRFRHAVDIGGGFGRLSLLLREYADRVTLTDPSETQLTAAEKLLADTDIERRQMQADDLQFADGELDLITMVRVMHHIPEPSVEFGELARVLAADGCAIIEVANYGHALNRLKHLRRRQPMPTEPVSILTSTEHGSDSIAFVNHNIDTVVAQLAAAGLLLDRKLSVSNLRSATLKKVLPTRALLGVERILQRPLARLDFGPSIFLQLRKA